MKSNGHEKPWPECLDTPVLTIAPADAVDLIQSAPLLDDVLSELKSIRLKLDDLEDSLKRRFSLAMVKNRAHALDLIIRTVAEQHGFAPKDLLGRSRTEELAWARHIAMFLGYNLCGSSTQTIGKHFLRDHGTVIYAIRHVTNVCAIDPSTKQQVDRLQQSLAKAINCPRRS
jgi:chromosomal replication initiator protein